MHTHILKDATRAQLVDFLTKQIDELKHYDEELHDEMECELYLAVYGPHFSEWAYDKAVTHLENADGTVGPHWEFSAVRDYANQRGLAYDRFNEYDFAYVMNVMYSDYFGSVNDSPESYYKLAKAFLEDKDAPEGKAWRYYKAMRH